MTAILSFRRVGTRGWDDSAWEGGVEVAKKDHIKTMVDAKTTMQALRKRFMGALTPFTY
jgi:hypothetical protein